MAKYNVAVANQLVREHRIPGALLPAAPGGKQWPGDECTIQYWIESQPDIHVDVWDDGSDHDKSTIKRYLIPTQRGIVVVWSYNNNAWGFADAYLEDEAPKDIEQFASDYIATVGGPVEQWLKDMAGYDEDA